MDANIISHHSTPKPIAFLKSINLFYEIAKKLFGITQFVNSYPHSLFVDKFYLNTGENRSYMSPTRERIGAELLGGGGGLELPLG